MPQGRYPKAIWRGDGYTTGSYTGGPWKLVLHTTETSGMPSYTDRAGRRGGSAPHVTYYPKTREFFQHTDFNSPARALRDAEGGVHTNRDSVIQLEIICYSDESVVDRYPNTGRVKVSELSDRNLEDIREFIDWVAEEFGVDKDWPGRRALNYSQANAPGFRLSNAEYEAYDGVLGHQHVPENTHWDPGGLNWNALLIEENDMSAVSSWALKAWDFVTSIGVMGESSLPKDPVNKEELAVFIERYNKHVKKLIAAAAAGGASTGAVINEIVQRLANG